MRTHRRSGAEREVSRLLPVSRRGFTLVELLVVVLIITILATIVGVSVLKAPGKARRAKAIANISAFKSAIQLYSMAHGSIPTQEQGLKALVEKPTAPPVPDNYPQDGYLDTRKLPKDPWGREYIYLVPGSQGESYEIICYGADGEPGGTEEKADISSSELEP